MSGPAAEGVAMQHAHNVRNDETYGDSVNDRVFRGFYNLFPVVIHHFFIKIVFGYGDMTRSNILLLLLGLLSRYISIHRLSCDGCCMIFALSRVPG